MEKFNSLRNLFYFINNSLENEWVYVNLDEWLKNPLKCYFYVIPETEVDEMPDDEVYESEEGPFLPISLRDLNLSPWMEIDTLKDVLQNLRIEDEKSFDENLFIRGINYFREYDDFMDA